MKNPDVSQARLGCVAPHGPADSPCAQFPIKNQKELKKSKAVEGYFSDFEEIHRQLATGASRPNFAASEIVKFFNL